jgi:uncharacterized protein
VRRVGCFLTAALVASAGAAWPSAAADYPITAVPFTAVRITDGFWGPRLETNRTVTIPWAFRMAEETGRIDNFRVAARLKPGQFVGRRYNDSDVYKIMEAAAFSLAVHPDPELDACLDSLISDIAAAQEPDGYLYTARTIDPKHLPPRTGETRFSYLEQSHELYDVGHMYEAAVAHFLATGKRMFLAVAIKNADLVCRTFGPAPEQHKGVPGHEEIEIGLVKLYRATGEPKYLRQAEWFLDQRGRARGRTLYTYDGDVTYAQDHLPVAEQREAVGHAVRALYLYSAMADVAALGGNTDYVKALDRLWGSIVGGKIYLTGGVGANGEDEAFGAPFELPNMTAYSETCAAVANVFFNQRMFLLHGDARYVDVLERTLYNAVLAGVSLSGDRFFYDNPLASCRRNERTGWFDCSCCPPNVARLLASLSGYIYAVRERELFVNLFVGSRAAVGVAGTPVTITQESSYPWSGTVALTLDPERDVEMTLRVRVPGWALDQADPGGLYRFAEPSREAPRLSVNGVPAEIELVDGYACLRRTWKRGDRVVLELPMPLRVVRARAEVRADVGRFAFLRGPLVFAAEGPDNGGRTANLTLDPAARYEDAFTKDLLGGVETVRGRARAVIRDDVLGLRTLETGFVAIPYYAWAHRGPSEMTVWFPTETSQVPPPEVTVEPYGQMPDGRKVTLFTIVNRNNVRVQITNFGGKVVSLVVPDRAGTFADVVLGYATLDEWVKGNPYFGALIGRYANRIAGGAFALDGKGYALARNNGPNALHGGPGGFHEVVWDATELDTDEARGVELTYVSKDGEEGYPGTLRAVVTYTLNNRNELEITYRATTDKPTVVNLTHHSFFNLRGAGNGDILGHRLTIAASRFTPVDATLIPTGELRQVAGTPFDFTTPHAIGERIAVADQQLRFGNGYDHNFVLDGETGSLRQVAVVVEPESGRRMEVLTTEPGLQLYSGNFLDGTDKGKQGIAYRFRSAFCLEAQHFPDSPNQPAFPTTVLRPGERYVQRTVYRFSTE